MPNLVQKQVVNKRVGLLPGTCLALLFSAAVQATPPPEAVAEGFGVPTAVATEPGTTAVDATAVDTTAVDATADMTTAEKIAALLAETPDELDYGTVERCLSRNKVKRYEVLDDNLLLVHGRKGNMWINQFERKCVGLRRNMALIMEIRGAQVCANDRFYARQSWERMDNIGRRGTSLGSVRCTFEPFESVSEEQVEMIKQAVKQGVFR